MSSVNLYAKEISLKIVYYGPGLGGKTSSLQYIHRAIKPDARGQLVSLSTGVDRTLYFDFLPVKLPKLRGYTVRVQLYTVPGQVHYNSTRKLVLTGADGIVFVADSQKARREANIESFQNLQENLREQGLALDRLPHLLQYNKRDMPELMSTSELDAALNPYRVLALETSAATGLGVFEALKSITTLVLSDLRRRGVWRADGPATNPGAPAVPPPSTIDPTTTPLLGEVVPPSELRDEPSTASMPKEPGTDPSSSIAQSLQLLAEREPEPPPPSLSPLKPEEPVVDGGKLARGAGLSEMLPPGALRDAIVGVEYLVHRGDYAGAVAAAARTFNEAARAGATVAGAGAGEGPALHALMLGLPGERYLRFRDTVARAASGGASSADALFTIFFLVDTALRSKG
ncbi:MAG TPA: GTPase domain-containing protein [Polyangia bacterium]|nr:GTPase domain-containing protein [Polyangia bacterium]